MSTTNATADAATTQASPEPEQAPEQATPAGSPAPHPVPTNIPVQLEADEDTDDGVSELASTVASSSTSVSSSIRGYREENGRTYHKYKDGKYSFPNDERENDRLDLQHNLYLLTLDNVLGLAPPNNPDSQVKRVLDVGTGTGIWAIEFGDEHPKAEVLGIDLSPIMPDFVPPNVKFEIDDLEEEWTWTQPFDYIFSRMMNASISDWSAYAKKAYDNLTPGGYLELQEIDVSITSDDGTLKPDFPLAKCMKLMIEASVILGRPYQQGPALAKVLEDAGFVDVKLNLFKWPMNAWPKNSKYKELGIWTHENLLAGLEALTMAPFTRAHGWTKEEVQVFLASVRKELPNRAVHAYWPIYVIYGRKPTEEELEKSS